MIERLTQSRLKRRNHRGDGIRRFQPIIAAGILKLQRRNPGIRKINVAR